ncbi:ABC transporter ATP-binding protein [Cognatiyoonia sp. IB215446]|uniref:ABC transporter ATP-binding protein n=1 Tax=Cognatiyoonia sp. IB215446 TaxID=3097355 RepID=UPI002A1542BB|nr:ABC transporter ATP-binding protein [Cognatiyoonia sp. IB215446]MDX8350433.1 ABC transporter ATP-binding protein [Cognatiyoonia sp. IB215446]
MLPYRQTMTLVVLSILAVTATGLLAPWLVREIVLIVETGAQDATRNLTWIAVGLVLIYVGRSTAEAAVFHYSHVVAFNTCRDLRDAVYAHLQRLSPSWFAARKSGDITKRVIDDTLKLEPVIADAVYGFVVSMILAFGILIILFNLSPLLTLLALIPLPVALFIMVKVGRKAIPSFDNEADREGQLAALVQDHVSGIREIQIFNQEHATRHSFQRKSDFLARRQIRSRTLIAPFDPAVEGAIGVSTALVVLVGGRMALMGEILVADLVAFILYIVTLYQPLFTVVDATEAVQRGLSSLKRVNNLLDTAPEVADPAKPTPLPQPVRGAIALENVSFAYRADTPVLQDVTLAIQPGETLAVIGATGAGKSTLAHLIARFYDVAEGKIALDGIDLRDLRLADLRGATSMVLQDVFLFNGTIRENIRFGRQNADEDAVMSAAKAAGAHAFITDLPKGYETLVGERGIRLSGGQKQRISIARALLKNAPILILDEATSAVDTETEAAIQDNLDQLLAGRTAIVIAHRLSTIRRADRIAVLENGRLIQLGAHDQIAHEAGAYARLLQAQESAA